MPMKGKKSVKRGAVKAKAKSARKPAKRAAAKKTTKKKVAKKKSKAKKAKGKVKKKAKAKAAKVAKPSKAKKGKATKAVSKFALVGKKDVKKSRTTVAAKAATVVAGRNKPSVRVRDNKIDKTKKMTTKQYDTIESVRSHKLGKSGQRNASEFGMMGIPPYKEAFGEEYMNEKQRAHFRMLLNHWKHELMEEVDRTVHHMQDEAANFPDPNDRATQEEEFSLELRTRDRERKLIKKIEEALQKLENNEYGYCDACGIEIGIRRLEARPTATLCIDCKTLDEIKERQMAG